MYQSAVYSPPRWQWESSSGTFSASQSNNCGPTCVTKIADFYKDAKFGIEATRRLVMGCCVPTSPSQQRDMLQERGVPAYVAQIDSIAQMRALNPNGTRPFVIGIYMARVPASVRDHPFTGWHALVVLDSDVLLNGVRGMYIMDPNFSPPGGIRPDPDKGVKFYSDSVLQYAFISNSPRWAIIPIAAKQIYIPPPPPPANNEDKIEGDPGLMFPRYRTLVDEATGQLSRATIKPNKPIRTGAYVSSPTRLYTGSTGMQARFWGRIPYTDLPAAEQKYGDVFLMNIYHVNGHHVGYVKGVDIE